MNRPERTKVDMATPPRDSDHSDTNRAAGQPPVTPADLSRWRADDVPNFQAVVALAEKIRAESSQQTSKFAAVLFDTRTGEILGASANQFASGLAMSNGEMRRDRDLKDKSIAHAEERVLDQYTRRVLNGEAKPVPPQHLGLYATNFCCPRCGRKISEQGIGLFVSTTNSLDTNDRFARNWASDIMLGKQMLDQREARIGGPVRTRLVTLPADPHMAAQGHFNWADMRRDHFTGVRHHAELHKMGKAGYVAPGQGQRPALQQPEGNPGGGPFDPANDPRTDGRPEPPHTPLGDRRPRRRPDSGRDLATGTDGGAAPKPPSGQRPGPGGRR